MPQTIPHIFALLISNSRHGFIDKYGTAIDNPHDTLLDPEIEYIDLDSESGVGLECDEGAKLLNPSMTCEQRNMYCSGVSSFSLCLLLIFYLPT